MSLRKIALFPVVVILLTIIISFAMDFITILVYLEDARTQAYLGGFYVAGMAADPTALASGSKDSGELYKDEDIIEEFINFSNASFLSMTEEIPEERTDGKKHAIRYKIDKMLLKNIVTQCEIVTSGGVKGVNLTVEFQVDPRVNRLLPEAMPDFPYYRMHITRRFRILG